MGIVCVMLWCGVVLFWGSGFLFFSKTRPSRLERGSRRGVRCDSCHFLFFQTAARCIESVASDGSRVRLVVFVELLLRARDAARDDAVEQAAQARVGAVDARVLALPRAW